MKSIKIAVFGIGNCAFRWRIRPTLRERWWVRCFFASWPCTGEKGMPFWLLRPTS